MSRKPGSSILTTIVLTVTTMQLALMPVLELHACGYPHDPDLREAKRQCDQNQAKNWDCNTNRCLNTQASIDDRHEYEDCMKIEDDKARKQCHDDYAEGKVGDLEEGGDDGGSMASGVMGMAVGLAAINFFGKEGKKSKCMCKTVFAGAAIAGLAGELYTYMSLEKELDELRERYEKEAVNENPYQAQLRAFQFLKEEQETIAKIAEKKATTYKLVAAAYAAAAAVAVYDMVQNPNCASGEETTPGGTGGKPAAPTKGSTFKQPTYLENGLMLLIPSAHAADEKDGSKKDDKKKKQKLFAMLIGAGAGVAMGMLSKKMAKFFSSPTGILIVSGIAAALAWKLAKAAERQAEKAKKNAEKIQEIIDMFTKNMASFCPAGREDMENPDCYCYNRDGSQNPNRTNSQTCQGLWASRTNRQAIGAGSYTKSAGGHKLGCVDLNGKFDQDCKCRKYKDQKTGKNACYKSGFNNLTLGKLGTATSLNEIGGQIDQLSQGNWNDQNFNSGRWGQHAIKNRKIAKKMVDQYNRKQPKKSKVPFMDPKVTKSVLGQITTKKMMAAARGGPLDSGSMGGNHSDAGDALKKALEKTGLNDDAKVKYKKGSGKAILGKKGKKGAGFNFSLDDGKGGSSPQMTFQEDKSEYNYRNNDITTDEDVPIWKIISKRYNMSALKRLFFDDNDKE
jgi:hypothetical protein